MRTKQDLPILELRDQRAWEQWLEANHDTSIGVWLKFEKKGSPRSSVTRAEALEAAICYGWIDGQAAACDESSWLQRFTRRRPRSKWSQINRAAAEQLIAQGRMRPAGIAAVEAAKEDGRWEAAYPSQAGATVPEDFQRALDHNPQAKTFFATLKGVNRYAFLYRLYNVSGADARAERIATYIAMLNRGETFYP